MLSKETYAERGRYAVKKTFLTIEHRQILSQMKAIEDSQYMIGTTNQKQMIIEATVFISDHH